LSRVTVHHLTRAERLPLIEVEGLRTRADLSRRLGAPGDEDRAAPGTFAHGRRVSSYLVEEHALSLVDRHGPGRVTFTVDPAKALAVPGSARTGDPEDYWAASRALAEWLEDGPPDDLEVHQNVPVRAKHLRILSPLVSDEDLDDYAPIVRAVADDDRVMAKALMHLAIIDSEADFRSPAFLAAAALAWRDEPDPDELSSELFEVGVDRIASAALAEHGAGAHDAVLRLRAVLDDTREWSQDQGVEASEGILLRSAAILQRLDENV
jgi:hypothetical protein